jgi:GntR family transcriptional regulator
MAMTTSSRAVASSVIVRALAIVLRGVAPPPSGGQADPAQEDATADQADLLGIPTGEPLLTRCVPQQSAGIRRFSLVYLPFSVAERTPWADNPRLPSPAQLYNHFTETGHQLTWVEHVRARMPIGDETTSLAVLLGVPLLIVLRVTHAAADPFSSLAPLVLEEIRHRADQAELAYPLA